jgi:hypothetical protein
MMMNFLQEPFSCCCCSSSSSSARKLGSGILLLQTDPHASVGSSDDACMHATLGIAVESCWVLAFFSQQTWPWHSVFAD